MPSCEFEVHVTPRSSQKKVEASADSIVKIWVTQAPTDGQANQGVIEVLSEALGVAKSRIEIRKGLTSRKKLVRVEGLDLSQATLSLQSGPQGTKSPKPRGK